MNAMFKKIYKKIKDYETIVIARHIGPDPDAIASQISLRDSIKLTFPDKNVLAVGAGVSRFKYYGLLDKSPLDTSKALLIVLDLPNIARLDGVDINSFKEVIKIDHHPFEDKMGELEIVDETASSTCQIIAEMVLETKLKLNTKIAENLFLGIVSDSDRFLLSYTTAKTFKIVSDLLFVSKIDFTSLYKYLYDRPIEEIKFHGFISNNLNITENGLAYIKITPEDIKEYGVDIGTASNMINDFNFIKGVKVWTFVTFDDKKNIYKINIRSRGPIVNEIASNYNGGGHKFACGARVEDESLVDKLLNDLDDACREYSD